MARRIYRFLSLMIIVFCSQSVFAGEKVEEIVAAHVRRQGFACKKPVGAEPMPENSQPEEMAWRLQCANAIYEVRLIPHSAAIVKVLAVLTE